MANGAAILLPFLLVIYMMPDPEGAWIGNVVGVGIRSSPKTVRT